VTDHRDEDPLYDAKQHELRKRLGDLMRKLTSRERDVVCLRYGLADNCPRTLKEVGDQLKVTRERVRQIESRALGKLRQSDQCCQLLGFLDGDVQ
jgi:RNA polymerase primary sigma factor